MKSFVVLIVFAMLVAGNAFAQQQKAVVPYSSVSKTPAAAPAKSPVTNAPAANALATPSAVSKERAGDAPTFTAAPVAPVTFVPVGYPCDGLPTTELSGAMGAICDDQPVHFGRERADLAFGKVCFFRPINETGGAPNIFIEGQYYSKDISVPSSIGVHARIIPNIMSDKSYDICQNGMPSGDVATSSQMFFGIPSVGVGIGDPFNDFRIILDPRNDICETNKRNNIIRCTSFEIAPDDARGNPGPYCITPDPINGYDGRCYVIDIP